MSEPTVSLPQQTMERVHALPDGPELFELTDHADVVAWLDAHGLDYTVVGERESDADRIRRLFGGRAVG